MLGAQQRNRWWNNLCHNATLANQKPEVINGKGTKTTMAPHKGKSYVWTDTEVELLLSVTLEYEVNKIQENEDWESSQSKYSNILALFLEQYRSETPLEKKKKSRRAKKEELSCLHINTENSISEYIHPGRSHPKAPLSLTWNAFYVCTELQKA